MNLKNKLIKEENKLLYDNDVDVKEYLEWCDKIKEIEKSKKKVLTKAKENKKKTNSWCFLGKEEYMREIKEAESGENGD